MPSWPLGVPELPSELGGCRQESFCLLFPLSARDVKTMSAHRGGITRPTLPPLLFLRRMFPSVRVKVRNLDPCQQYYIAMDVMPVDSKRYRWVYNCMCVWLYKFNPPYTLPPRALRYVYHSSQWMVAGNTDHSCISPRLYVHPDSPCAGETWMRQVISFDRVKLTNNEMDDKGHVGDQAEHAQCVCACVCWCGQDGLLFCF